MVGFTQGDVEEHRRYAEHADIAVRMLRKALDGGGPPTTLHDSISIRDRSKKLDRAISRAAWHHSMADRVEALLPPEGA